MTAASCAAEGWKEVFCLRHIFHENCTGFHHMNQAMEKWELRAAKTEVKASNRYDTLGADG
jgi:hypothetical protein